MSLVSSGSPLEIPANDWNDIQSMLDAWRAGRLQFGAGVLTNVQSSLVWVKNESQNDVAPGDILGLGDPVISPTDNIEEFKTRFAFKGAVPSTSTPNYGQYGVVQESADKSDGFCRCVVAGVTFVKLNITHAADKYCEIANNVSTYLTTGALGSSYIIWKSSGTGSTDKWGLIRVGDRSGQILVKNLTGSAIAAGTTGTATVHKGSDESSTGQTLTVKNRTSVSWANDKFGTAEFIEGTTFVSPQQT